MGLIMTAWVCFRKTVALILPKKQFARNVAILFYGTMLARAIQIIASLILTRIYPPDEFGLVAVYMAIVGILSVIGTARYEMAIPLVADDLNAFHLVGLTLTICVVFSIVLYIPVILFNESIAQAIGNADLRFWLYFLPISVMVTGAFNTFQFWYNRKAQFSLMARARVQNVGYIAVANIMFGFGGLKSGMVLGNVFGSVFNVLLIGRSVYRFNHPMFAQLSKKGVIEVARKYDRHLKHLTPSHLIGTIAFQVPVLLINNVYGAVTAGFFSMAYHLISMPIVLLGNAIGDVYRQQIAVTYNERGEFKEEFLKTLKATTFLALLPFGLLYFVAPHLFAFAFGEQWRVSGEYAQILVTASFFQFIFTPVDKTAIVVGATKYIFLWHMARFLSFGLLWIIARTIPLSVEIILWCFVVINACLYAVEGVVGYHFSRGGR